jgi:hypothetical protein
MIHACGSCRSIITEQRQRMMAIGIAHRRGHGVSSADHPLDVERFEGSGL